MRSSEAQLYITSTMQSIKLPFEKHLDSRQFFYSRARDSITRYVGCSVCQSVGPLVTLSFSSVYGRVLRYCSYPNAWLAFFGSGPGEGDDL